MANEIKRYVPLVQNKGEINYQQNSVDYHTYKIIDGKIVIEFISCNRNAKQKLLNGYCTGTDGKQNFNSRIKVLTCFTLTSIVKIIEDTLYGQYISYKIGCCYKEDCFSQAYNFTLEIPEDNLLSHNIKGIIAKQVGDAFNPFPLSTSDHDINTFLSAYIVEFYNMLDDRNKTITKKNRFGFYVSSDEFVFIQNKKCNLKINQINSSKYLKDFFNLLENCDYSVLSYYYFFFAAAFKDFLKMFMFNSTIPLINKSFLLAQDFRTYEDRAYLMAFVSPFNDVEDIVNLSELKQTKHKNLIKETVYNNPHNTIIVNDDMNINNYTKSQNLSKMNEIASLITGETPVTNANGKSEAECNIIFLSDRYYTELPDAIKHNFIAIKSPCLWNKHEYSPQNIKEIVLRFTKVLTSYIFEIADDESLKNSLLSSLNQQLNFKRHCRIQCDNKNILSTFYSFKLMVIIIDNLFNKYSIATNSINAYMWIDTFYKNCLKYERITDSVNIEKEFIKSFNLHIEHTVINCVDDYKRGNPNAVYYIEADDILLFNLDYFYEKFLNEPIMSNTDFRKLLYDKDILISNMGDKLLYRMPTGDRKTYIGINAKILNETARQNLPIEKEAASEWSCVKTDYNILIGNDMNNKLIYWPVGKSITNKFAVVLGNSGYGKTYWTTSVLIKQLHDNRHKVLIIENSFIHNYSISELKKALPEDYIENEFCFFSKWKNKSGSSLSESEAILEFFIENPNKIMVIDSYIEKELYKFIKALISFQQSCKESEEEFENVFIVLDEATTEDIQKNKELEIIYNQGRKLGISMITILQYFSGKNSENFRKKIFQAALKVTFNMNGATVGKFLSEFPDCDKNKLKKDISQLNRGEAVICGEFEDTEGNIKKGICYKSAD